MCCGACGAEHEPGWWLDGYRPVDGDDSREVMSADHGVVCTHSRPALVTDTNGRLISCGQETVETVHLAANSSLTSAALGTLPAITT